MPSNHIFNPGPLRAFAKSCFQDTRRACDASPGSIPSWAPTPRPGCANLTLGVQSSTAARAGRRGLQEAGAPRGARSYAEQPEGPKARPGRGLQQLSVRQGPDGGSEARGSGAQGAGHAAQQGKHRRAGTCEVRTTRPRHAINPRTTGSPASAREALTSEGVKPRTRLRPLLGAASAAGRPRIL